MRAEKGILVKLDKGYTLHDRSDCYEKNGVTVTDYAFEISFDKEKLYVFFSVDTENSFEYKIEEIKWISSTHIWAQLSFSNNSFVKFCNKAFNSNKIYLRINYAIHEEIRKFKRRLTSIERECLKRQLETFKEYF